MIKWQTKKLFLLFLATLSLLMIILIGWKIQKKISNNTETNQTLTLFNWGEYLNPQIITDFEKQTNIKVKQVLFSSNELAITKIKSKNQYDLAILSEYAIDQLIQEQILEKIDNKIIKIPTDYDSEYIKLKDKLPNKFNDYAVPYFWGKIVIIYNKNTVNAEIKDKIQNQKLGFNILKEPKFKVALCNNARDGLMVGLKATGSSINTSDKEELEKAKKWLLELKEQKTNLTFINDQLIDRMSQPENEYYDVAIAYLGDAKFLKEKNPNLEYFFPHEGTNVWIDALVMPQGSQTSLAQKFINFLMQFENYQKNLVYMKYDSPYEGFGNTIKIEKEDDIYKYNAKAQKIINTFWNDIIAFPSQKDYWLFIISFCIFFFIFVMYSMKFFKKRFNQQLK